MRRIPAFLLILAGATAPAALGAQSCPPRAQLDSTSARLQRLVDSLSRANPTISGISLAVIGRGGCMRFEGATGIANRATGERLTPAHTHRIASNTKTYVAAAVMRLVEDGRLSLDDPITRHLSAGHLAALRRDGYDVDRITVRHLITHRAGIYDYAMDNRFIAVTLATPTHRWTRSEQVDSAMTWGAPYGAPGEVYHYTDTGYILLAEVVERITGQGLAPALRSLLNFERLQLGATWLESLEPQPATAGPRAHQYIGPQDTYGFDASVDLYGGGGLVATPMDMARFTRALLTGQVFRSPATLTTMQTTMGSSGPPRVYAAGLSGVQVGNVDGWGHSGFWNTWSYHFPAHDVTLAASVTEQTDRTVSRALLEQATRVVFR
jgi:D-alanyl-D-alanine carboxypeptidase